MQKQHAVFHSVCDSPQMNWAIFSLTIFPCSSARRWTWFAAVCSEGCRLGADTPWKPPRRVTTRHRWFRTGQPQPPPPRLRAGRTGWSGAREPSRFETLASACHRGPPCPLPWRRPTVAGFRMSSILKWRAAVKNIILLLYPNTYLYAVSFWFVIELVQGFVQFMALCA